MFVKIALTTGFLAIVIAKKFASKSKNSPAEKEIAPVEADETSEVTDFVAPEVTVGGFSESMTKTASTVTASITASECVVESVQEDEATSKPQLVGAIDIDAVAGTDSLEITPRKSSFSKLMKKVSNAVSSPRKQSSV